MDKLWGVIGLAVVLAVGVGIGRYWGASAELQPQPRSSVAKSKVPYRPQAVSIESTANTQQGTEQGTEQEPLHLAKIAGIVGDFEQTVALYRLLADKNPEQLVALIDESYQYFRGSDYRSGTSIMFSRLAELDPSLAINKAVNAKSTSTRLWIMAIFQALARQDYEYAVAQASLLPGNLRTIAGQAIVRSSPDLTLAQKELAKSELGVDAPLTLSGRDPNVVWQDILNLPNRNKRRQAMVSLITSLASADPDLAMTFANSVQNEQLRRQLSQRALILWGQADPAAAPANGSPNLVGQLIGLLAKEDLEAARLAINRLDESTQTVAYAATLPTWLEQDPAAALDWVANNPTALGSQRLRSNILNFLVEQDLRSAFQWVEDLPALQRAQTSSRLISIVANSDIQAAAREVATTNDEQLRQKYSENLMGHWARTDPQQAAAWLQDQRLSNSSEAYQKLAGSWANRDFDAATDFALDLPDGADRDAALNGIILSAFSNITQNIDQTLNAFAAIEQPQQRQLAANVIHSALSQIDPAQAAQFAQDHNLDISQFRPR